jgi:hypothetical protein
MAGPNQSFPRIKKASCVLSLDPWNEGAFPLQSNHSILAYR